MPKCMPRQTARMEAMNCKDGSIGISYPMLTKSDYTAWSLKMKVYMQAHEIWNAIESTGEKTTVRDKVDKTALAAIYQGIPEDILLSIAEKRQLRRLGRLLR